MPNPNGMSPNFGSAFNCLRSISVPVSATLLGSQNNWCCFLFTKAALAHLMPLYVFPKMSSHTLRLSKSAESYASNADFTSYSAIAVVGPKSKLPSSQVATPAIFAHKRTRAMFPSLVAESPPADCRGHAGVPTSPSTPSATLLSRLTACGDVARQCPSIARSWAHQTGLHFQATIAPLS